MEGVEAVAARHEAGTDQGEHMRCCDHNNASLVDVAASVCVLVLQTRCFSGYCFDSSPSPLPCVIELRYCFKCTADDKYKHLTYQLN